MANFIRNNDPSAELTLPYITDSEILDRFVGNKLLAAGSNSIGEQGINIAPQTLSARSVLSYVTGNATNWSAVSAGYDSVAAIKSDPSNVKTDGTLWVWGANDVGQLGDNSRTHRSSPVQTVAGGNNWQQIAVSWGFNINGKMTGIKTDGTLWTWGANDYGELGTNDMVHRSSPVQTVAGGNNWKQVDIGLNHIAAIKTDGTLWVWGNGDDGKLGIGILDFRSSPVQTIYSDNTWKQVSCGANHTAAVKTDGTLWVWGSNTVGELGTNNRTTYSIPVETIASGGTNWKQVSCGYNHTAAIKTDGTLWLWGLSSFGKLGTGDTVHRSSPVQTVTGGTNWKQVACGVDHTAAIKTDGSLWTWGYNNLGQLADDSITHRSSPVQVVTSTNDRVDSWKQVSAGNDMTLAVTLVNA